MGNTKSNQVVAFKQINVCGVKKAKLNNCDDECNPKTPAPTPQYKSVVCEKTTDEQDFEGFVLDNHKTIDCSVFIDEYNSRTSSENHTRKNPVQKPVQKPLVDITRLVSSKRSSFKYAGCNCNTFGCDFCYVSNIVDNLEINRYSI
jgi:hypothetical protein